MNFDVYFDGCLGGVSWSLAGEADKVESVLFAVGSWKECCRVQRGYPLVVALVFVVAYKYDLFLVLYPSYRLAMLQVLDLQPSSTAL